MHSSSLICYYYMFVVAAAAVVVAVAVAVVAAAAAVVAAVVVLSHVFEFSSSLEPLTTPYGSHHLTLSPRPFAPHLCCS